MKIHPVGAEFFHTDGRTDGLTDTHEANESFFGILRTLKKRKKKRKVSKMYVKCLAERLLDGFENSYFGYVDRIKFSQLVTKL
jgi:hypothetical protein